MNDQSNYQVEHLAGGTLRVSDSAPTSEPTYQAPESSRVYNQGLTRDDGAPLPSNTGSVLATARNNGGPTGNLRTSDASVELEPGNPSSRTSVAVAVALGALREIAPGIYGDANASPSQPVSQQPASPLEPTVQQDSAPELFDNKTEADWAADIEPLAQDAYDQAIVGASSAILSDDPEGWASVADHLAASARISRDAADAYVEAGYGVYESQVAALAETQGIKGTDKEAFYDYCRTSRPEELRKAVQALTIQRRLDGFRGLLQDFKADARK